MKPRFLLLTASIIGCLLLSLVAGDPKRQRTTINVADIGDSVMLVGRLGKPLGQKLTIRGTWSLPKDVVNDFSPRFTVTSVDHQQLSNPVEFNLGQMRLLTPDHRDAIPARKHWDALDSVEWQLIAYETGRIEITPDEYREKNPVFPNVGMPYYTKPFTSQLVAVRTEH